MSTPRLLAAALALACSGAFAAGPNLGKPITPAEIAPWDISIQPDGAGLPPGGGTPAQGQKIFAQKCAACHGENARGGRNTTLVGGDKIVNMDSTRTIANFWPYATTVFDYIRRAMPWPQPRSLSDNEVYALTAYILSENKLIGPDDSMNSETLPKVRMPNRDGFILRFPDKIQ
ncbi:MAG TPA: cytochrome c [Burkholderiales bacterium]